MTQQEGFMRSSSSIPQESAPSTTYTNNGGVMRAQIGNEAGAQEARRQAAAQGRADQAQPQWTPTAQASTGTMRTTLANGGTTEENLADFARGTSGDSEAASGKYGIVASARSNGGRQLGGNEITRASLVTVHGTTTTMGAAIAMGLVRQDGRTGLYVDMNDSRTPVAPQTPKEARAAALQAAQAEAQQMVDAEQAARDEAEKDTVPDMETFDEATEALIADTVTSLGTVNAQTAIHALVNTGSLPEALVATLAGTMGIEASKVTGIADTLVAAFSKQAAAAIGPAAADAVWAWARENQPAALKDAMVKHANQGTTKGYVALASAYYAALGDTKEGREVVKASPNAQAMGVYEDRAGKLWVNVKGVGRVGWGVAVRNGLIATKH